MGRAGENTAFGQLDSGDGVAEQVGWVETAGSRLAELKQQLKELMSKQDYKGAAAVQSGIVVGLRRLVSFFLSTEGRNVMRAVAVQKEIMINLEQEQDSRMMSATRFAELKRREMKRLQRSTAGAIKQR